MTEEIETQVPYEIPFDSSDHPRFKKPGPVYSKPQKRERAIPFEGICLTSKQWKQLRGWVRENRELISNSDVQTVVECARLTAGQFERWRLLGTHKWDIDKKLKMACHRFAKEGWTGCPLGKKSIDAAVIKEAMKVEKMETIPDTPEES